MKPTQQTNESGFSLVEVMIAMVLLLFGLIGLAGVFAQGIRGNGAANQQSTATAVAEQRIEQLEQKGFDYIVSNYSNIDAALPQVALPEIIKSATTTITLFDALGNVTNSAGNPVRAEIKVTVVPVSGARGTVTLVKHISKSI
jgi:prepilin-type N-terminal cleavage/methylation domain-containing protein